MNRCVVLGTAPCMWDDLARAPDGWDVIAVNRAGFLYLDPIVAHVGIHGARDMVRYDDMRRVAGGDMSHNAYGNFAESEDSGRVIRANRPNGGGSSSLFAVLIALDLGYERIVLAGVPLEGQTGTVDELGTQVVFEPSRLGYGVYRHGWEREYHRIKDNVRSLSGWTKELLGEPTAEWIND